MISDIKPILNKLDVDANGRYEGKFYVIHIKNSDDYARYYTKLDSNAINTEYPQFGVNTNNSTIEITNYFETEVDNVEYSMFLKADFDKDLYSLKISEK